MSERRLVRKDSYVLEIHLVVESFLTSENRHAYVAHFGELDHHHSPPSCHGYNTMHGGQCLVVIGRAHFSLFPYPALACTVSYSIRPKFLHQSHASIHLPIPHCCHCMHLFCIYWSRVQQRSGTRPRICRSCSSRGKLDGDQ